MVNRERVSSGVKFEKIVGYSRAVRVGNQIFISGTTGADLTGNQGSKPTDAYSQTKKAIANIDLTLQKLGSSLQDVVRTRVFVRADADWMQIAKAHEESFGSILPASTMLVGLFLDPRILVEIEADAIAEEIK